MPTSPLALELLVITGSWTRAGAISKRSAAVPVPESFVAESATL